MNTTWTDVSRHVPDLLRAAYRAGFPRCNGTLKLEPGTPARLRWTQTTEDQPVPGGDTLADTPADCLAIITTRTVIYDQLADAIEDDMAREHGRLIAFPTKPSAS